MNTGVSTFEATPFVIDQDHTVCCVVKIMSGKEYISLNAHISKSADGSIVIDIQEQGVKAFEGAAIAASATDKSLKSAVDIINPVSGIGTAAKILLPSKE